jgi:hypothetical protein
MSGVDLLLKNGLLGYESHGVPSAYPDEQIAPTSVRPGLCCVSALYRSRNTELMMKTENHFDAAALADTLIEQCRLCDYAGDDPFDGLNSRLFQASRLGALPFAKVAWLQFHKRSPVNFRRLAGVPRVRNSKGVALILLGLLEQQQRAPDSAKIREALSLGEWLLDQRVNRSVWKHSAWGYSWDWAARAFFVPTDTPNAITTCYVARALYALGHASGDTRFTDVAVDAGFFLDSLYIEQGDTSYYAYIPGESAFVHNASLWTAALVSETARRTGDQALRHRALTATRRSVSMQRGDGAWLYGTRHHHAFVDGFHTGYNLEALQYLQQSLKTDEFSSVIDLGLAYYRRSFFLPDGTVKYYDNKIWPLDTHSVAQALITLLNVGQTEDDHRLATKVMNRAFATLYMPAKRRFVYQKGRMFTNRVNYIRWTQAWALYAVSIYANRVCGASSRMDQINVERIRHEAD